MIVSIVSYRTHKCGGLRLTRLPVTRDTVLQDTLAGVDTIGRLTPAYYGFCYPPVEHGSSTNCKPGALPLALARLVC